MKETNLYKKMENDKRIIEYDFGKKFTIEKSQLYDLPFKMSNKKTFFLPFNKCSLNINNNSIVTVEHIKDQPHKIDNVYKFSILVTGETGEKEEQQFNNDISMFKGYFIPYIHKSSSNKTHEYMDLYGFIYKFEIDSEYNFIVILTTIKKSFDKNMKLKYSYDNKEEEENEEDMNNIRKSVSRGVLLTTLYFKNFIEK